MTAPAITLICIGVGLVTFCAGFYFGWNEGAGWVWSQLGKTGDQT